jgi:hypothetical protein
VRRGRWAFLVPAIAGGRCCVVRSFATPNGLAVINGLAVAHVRCEKDLRDRGFVGVRRIATSNRCLQSRTDSTPDGASAVQRTAAPGIGHSGAG